MSLKVDEPNARTNNLQPLIWMMVLFTISIFGLSYGLRSLQKLQPTGIPVVNQLFLTEGTHRWVIQEDELCRGYIVGGWKKKAKLGERIWFKFKIPSVNGLTAQVGNIRANFGDFKNLESLTGNLNGRPISFDGQVWSSYLPPSSRELVLMIEGPNGTRLLKLPTPWNRDFNTFLSKYVSKERKLIEVDKVQLLKCIRELRI